MIPPSAWNRGRQDDPSDFRQRIWDNVVIASLEHSQAIEDALASPTRKEAVERVLRAGKDLDGALLRARDGGWSVEQLSTVPGLHPTYVEDLLGRGTVL